MEFPILKHYYRTKSNKKFRIRLKNLIWYIRKSALYWPTHKNSKISSPENIYLGVSDEPGNKVGGCYIQGLNGILLGGYTYIGPNVGIISANHQLNNLSFPIKEKPVIIGKYCWIGVGAKIMPGVQLGDHVIVGANSVVTRDVPSYSVVVGNPGRVIKKIDPDSIEYIEDECQYFGYIPKNSRIGKKYMERRIHFIKDYLKDNGEIISDFIRNESLGNTVKK